VIRRVDQIKERGFPGAGCCGQYQQRAGGESASKGRAIEEDGRKVAEGESERAVRAMKVVRATADLA
jgi:hypothetical protein